MSAPIIITTLINTLIQNQFKIIDPDGDTFKYRVERVDGGGNLISTLISQTDLSEGNTGKVVIE
ncbi:MAG: hypothetical protein WCR54_07480 [Clostridia bacterium]